MAEPTEQQFGHYRLINLLGSGPYTSVYLGEHIRLKTQVAVKKVDVLMSPNWLDKFSLRVGAIAGLRHPNIARVLDFGVRVAMRYTPVYWYIRRDSCSTYPGISASLVQACP